MFHGAHGGGNIPYPLPTVGAETTLKHRHYLVQHGKMGLDIGAVVIHADISKNGRMADRVGSRSRRLTSIGGFDNIPRSGRNGRDVGGDGLAELPFLGETAVAVGDRRHPLAAAKRTPARLGSDNIGIGGLVVEIIAAGIETTSENMGIFLEGSPKVVVYVIVHVHSPEAIGLDMSLGEIGYGNNLRVAWHASHIDSQQLVVGIVAEPPCNHPVEHHGMNAVGNEVKTDATTIAGFHKSNFSYAL